MSVRSLVLWPTAGCNLACRYCYRGLDHGTMPLDVVDLALDKVERTRGPFHLQIAGGEPLLAPQLVTTIIDRVRERRLPASIAVQTNGTLLTPAIAEHWHRNGVQAGVSLDGIPSVNDLVRGAGAATLEGIQTLGEHDVGTRITCVLTSANVEHLASLALVLAQFPHVHGLGLDPLVRRGAAVGQDGLVATPDMIVAGISALHATLNALERRGRTLAWRELERVRRAARTQPGIGCGAYCHAVTGESLAVAPDGRAYPCSQYVGDPEHCLGHVRDLDVEHIPPVGPVPALDGPCATCPLEGRCPGDCPSRVSAGGAGAHVSCLVYRTLARLEGIAS